METIGHEKIIGEVVMSFISQTGGGRGDRICLHGL